MNFKSFYLIEASKQSNISEYITSEMIKILRDLAIHPERYDKYKEGKLNYSLPIKDFISLNKVSGTLRTIIDIYSIELATGIIKAGLPVLVNGLKKGSGGYATPNTIVIPFFNKETEEPFSYFDTFKNTLKHEFIHASQFVENNPHLKMIRNDKTPLEYISNPIERDAYIDGMFRNIIDYMSSEIKILNNVRKEQPGKYIEKNNKISKWFASSEEFVQFLKEYSDEIFDNNNKKFFELYYKHYRSEVFFDNIMKKLLLDIKQEFGTKLPTNLRKGAK